MRLWKLLCAIECVGILATWMWFSARAEGDPHPPMEQATPLSQPLDLASAVPSTAAVTAVEPASDHVAHASTGHAPNPWSAGADQVTLILDVVDEAGGALKNFSLHWTLNGGSRQWRASDPGSSRLLFTDLDPGSLKLEIDALGCLPFETVVQIRPAPVLQRHKILLSRAWRVVLWVRTSSGADLSAWLDTQFGIKPRAYEIRAIATDVTPTVHRDAYATIDTRSAWGSFIFRGSPEVKLPQTCAGALDLVVERPVIAAIWLDRILLGTVPIEPGMGEATLVVDESELLRQFARVRVRILDAMTGAPMEGAAVYLRGAAVGSTTTTTTSADGRADFSFVPPENYDLWVDHEGYGRGTRSVQVNPSELSDLGDWLLHPSSPIRARVLDLRGEPARRFQLLLFSVAGWTRPELPRHAGVMTNAEGWLQYQADSGPHQAILGGRNGIGLQAVSWTNNRTEEEERVIQLRNGDEVRLILERREGTSRLLWLLDAEGRVLSSGHRADDRPWALTMTPGNYSLRVEDLNRNFLTTLDLHVPDGGGELRVALP